MPLPLGCSNQMAFCAPELTDRKPEHEQKVSKRLNDREEDKDEVRQVAGKGTDTLHAHPCVLRCTSK